MIFGVGSADAIYQCLHFFPYIWQDLTALYQALILTGSFGEIPYIICQLEKAFAGTAVPIVVASTYM